MCRMLWAWRKASSSQQGRSLWSLFSIAFENFLTIIIFHYVFRNWIILFFHSYSLKKKGMFLWELRHHVLILKIVMQAVVVLLMLSWLLFLFIFSLSKWVFEECQQQGKGKESLFRSESGFFQEMDHHCIILLLLYFNVKETSVFNVHTI